jgi:ketosteroid isomerase-like protein
MSITREFYEAFQSGELHRWDALFAPDVKLNSPLRWGMVGLDTLKSFANELITALRPRVDLTEEYEGSGDRAFIVVTLHWKHVAPFFGVEPTGREGTSVECFVFTIEQGKIVRFDVSMRSVELALYLWARGWPYPHNLRPPAILQGTERRP